MILAPSILNIKKENLITSLSEFKDVGITCLHLDIMDGCFVPNTTRGVDLQEEIKEFDFVFDTHLMVNNPKEYIKPFVDAGSNMITFHYEAVEIKEIKPLIDYIKSLNVLCGISIKPNTDVRVLEPYLNDLDLILVMSVEPGFGGQKFMESSVDKVAYLSRMKDFDPDNHYIISVDGGINKDISRILANAGANMVVMGTSFIKEENKTILVDAVSNM